MMVALEEVVRALRQEAEARLLEIQRLNAENREWDKKWLTVLKKEKKQNAEIELLRGLLAEVRTFVDPVVFAELRGRVDAAVLDKGAK